MPAKIADAMDIRRSEVADGRCRSWGGCHKNAINRLWVARALCDKLELRPVACGPKKNQKIKQPVDVDIYLPRIRGTRHNWWRRFIVGFRNTLQVQTAGGNRHLSHRCLRTLFNFCSQPCGIVWRTCCQLCHRILSWKLVVAS